MKIVISILALGYMLVAQKILPLVSKKGESLTKFDSYYIDKSDLSQTVDISADGRYIILASIDEGIKLWDKQKKSLVKIFKSHNSKTIVAKISNDGKYLVSCLANNFVNVWSVETGKLLHTYKILNGVIQDLDVSGNGEFIVVAIMHMGNKEHMIEVRTKGGKLLNTLKRIKNKINSVAISANGRYIVSGSGDDQLYSDRHNSVEIWDRENGHLLKTFDNYGRQVNFVGVSGNGKYIVSSSESGIVKVWNWKREKIVNIFTHKPFARKKYITSLDISEDGKYVVASFFGAGSFRIWDIEKNKLIKFMEVGVLVNSVVISKDGKYVVATSSKNEILWERGSEKLDFFKTHKKFIDLVATDAKGRYIVSSSEKDKSIRVWDTKNNILINIFKQKDKVDDLDISRDSKIIVFATEKKITFLDRKTGKINKTLDVEWDSDRKTVLSADGRYLLYSDYKKFKLYDIKKEVIIKTFKGHYKSIKDLSISKNGTIIVSCSSNRVKVWDVKTGELLHMFSQDSERFSSVDIGENDKYVVSASNRMIRLWSIKTGKNIVRNYIRGGVETIVMKNTLDGFLAAIYNEIKPRDNLYTGPSFRSHTNTITSIDLTSNGRYIVSASHDGTVKLWDRKRTKLIKEFIGGLEGNWLVKDFSKNKFFRGDDGTFLLKKEVVYKDENMTVMKILETLKKI